MIYGVKATYARFDKSKPQKLSFYDLELESCPKNYFGANSVKNIDITKLYCLSAVQTTLEEDLKDLQIRGRFDSEKQGNLIFSVKQCNPSLRACLSDEEVKSKLQSSSVAVYYLDHSVDLGQVETPIVSLVGGKCSLSEPGLTLKPYSPTSTLSSRRSTKSTLKWSPSRVTQEWSSKICKLRRSRCSKAKGRQSRPIEMENYTRCSLR